MTDTPPHIHALRDHFLTRANHQLDQIIDTWRVRMPAHADDPEQAAIGFIGATLARADHPDRATIAAILAAAVSRLAAQLPPLPESTFDDVRAGDLLGGDHTAHGAVVAVLPDPANTAKVWVSFADEDGLHVDRATPVHRVAGWQKVTG